MENMFSSEGVTKSDRALHTPGTFAKNHLLYVQEVGKLESLTPHVCRRENLESYLIFEVTEGRGKVTVGEKDYELGRGDCVWLDCMEPFSHVSSADEPWKLSWVHFNGNCAAEFYALFHTKNQEPVFKAKKSAKPAKHIEKLLAAVKGNESELEMHALLTRLVTGCLIAAEGGGRLDDVRAFIDANCKEPKLGALLEKRFDATQGELEQQFYQSYGIGLWDYIKNRRFNAAKEMLRFTIQPIPEVIEKSGICDRDLFYTMFQNNEHMTPEEYRRNWAQWIKD